MKTINNAILRSVFSIVLGLVLILWPEATINYLVIIIGVLFIIPGLISIIAYFARDKQTQPTSIFPIEGAGSLLFGLWLVIMPTFFVNILMYVLGGLLVLAGIQQIVSLIAARKWANVSLWFYLIPTLILIAGVVILSNPFTMAANAFIFMGAVSLVYGITDLLNSYKFRRKVDNKMEL